MHCGIKPKKGLDLGLILADEPAAAAGVFTQNRVIAAPVVIAKRRVRAGACRAVLVNSGNANACTGRAGQRAALSSTRALAEELGASQSQVVPASTGVIGVQLPKNAIERAIPELVQKSSAASAGAFSRAILTTDRGPKMASAQFLIGKSRATVLGIAKGAGMIHPDMATTLAFIMTDVAVSPNVLAKALRASVDGTFNRITVDGDTSTNDMILLLASGQASQRALGARDKASSRFVGALTEVLGRLGELIVSDGEGAERLVRIEVKGARSDSAALQVAETIATSQLVKTAIHGCDPNWGRIVAAAGRAGVPFRVDDVNVKVGAVTVFRKGAPVSSAAVERKASNVMKKPRYTITLEMGKGSGQAHYWTCDLGHEYVRINADYRS